MSSSPAQTAAAAEPLHPTRAAGLDRLRRFVGAAGEAYTRGRNFARGDDLAGDVSRLSAYLQRRLVTEAEVISAVLDAHSAHAAEKFLQEVVWRTYWKGWLEQRPHVWERYCAALAAAPRPSAALAAACDGRSGVACLDAWVAELVATGYLHNHVRMWFASIWIHTLRLPWEQGAALFWHHLRDADAASNTLSWRWVAGLQTRGKQYLATAENIRRYTEGRWPAVAGLATAGIPLDARDADVGAAVPAALDAFVPPPGGRVGLLVHAEDLALECSEAATLRPVAVAALAQAFLPAPQRHGAVATAFGDGALDDALKRSARHFAAPGELLRPTAAAPTAAAAVAAWAEAAALDHVVLARPFAGPWHDALAAWLRDPRARPFRRGHDVALFPHATRGFFQLRRRLPRYLDGVVPAPAPAA